MKFRIENIGKIISADIKLDGLTVVAGSNDSGKSTAGRALYSLVSAYNKAIGYTDEIRSNLLFQTAELFYARYNPLLEKISLPLNLKEFKQMFVSDESELLGRLMVSVEEVKRLDETPRMQSMMVSNLYRMIRIIQKKDLKQSVIDEMNSVLYSEFHGKYQRIGTDKSYIYAEDTTGNVEVAMSERNVESWTQFEDFSFFTDVTYVESPLYLHVLSDLYYKARTMQSDYRLADVPAHVIDFARKIRSYVSVDLLHDSESVREITEILKEVFDITSGSFEKAEEQNLLTWKDKSGNEFSPINIASGIKSFGVLQMLIQSGYVKSDKLLIWDEPENHLHPEWQIQMAELMVKLVKVGVPILISSHSPYFIQAIRYAASKHGMEKFVNYYLSEEHPQENGVTLENVTDDLNRLFVKLAEPLDSIMNI